MPYLEIRLLHNPPTCGLSIGVLLLFFVFPPRTQVFAYEVYAVPIGKPIAIRIDFYTSRGMTPSPACFVCMPEHIGEDLRTGNLFSKQPRRVFKSGISSFRRFDA